MRACVKQAAAALPPLASTAAVLNAELLARSSTREMKDLSDSSGTKAMCKESVSHHAVQLEPTADTVPDHVSLKCHVDISASIESHLSLS